MFYFDFIIKELEYLTLRAFKRFLILCVVPDCDSRAVFLLFFRESSNMVADFVVSSFGGAAAAPEDLWPPVQSATVTKGGQQSRRGRDLPAADAGPANVR